jgi:hypothetical protein
MNVHHELRERRHALLFTVEQGCRRQGIRDWQTLRRYLLAATHTTQGRDLLIDVTMVDDYIAHRQHQITHKRQTALDRTVEGMLIARDRHMAEAFTNMIDALPMLGGVAC